MKAFGIVMGLFLVVILALGGVVAATWFKYANLGATQENRIVAIYDSNKVSLNTYTTKVQEATQVPAMYKADLQEIVQKTFEGRYGKDGSKAVVQFIQERNLNLDPGMYRQIQQIIEAGRNDFQTAQNQLVDAKRAYKTQLDMPWSGFWLSLAGYPKIDISKYNIVTLGSVETKFETGRDEVIKLR